MLGQKANGFSLIEAIVAMSITVVVLLAASSLIKKPILLQKKMLAAGTQQLAYRAVESIISDFKEAFPPSFDWSVIPPSTLGNPSSISFQKPIYSTGTLSPSSYTDYEFRYEAARRALVRRVNGVTREPPVLLNVDTPTTADPMFQYDPNPDALHVIIITILYHPEGTDMQRISRRVAIKG